MTSNELDVSRETFERLREFEALLKQWSTKINLVSRASLDDLWARHIVDSLQLVPLAKSGNWLDLGSGGGLPGLVLAIAMPETQLTLVESDQRKCAFLRNVVQKLGLSTKVIADRIEKCPPQNADVVSARALAPLGKLIGYAEPHMVNDGICVFPKGKKWTEEVKFAQEQWSFDLEVVKSKTQEDSAILKIRNIKRV